jgi:hypothetical protein
MSETTLPQRNFSISAAEIARAAIAGPPAWSLRLRRIENLEEEIVVALAEALANGAEPPSTLPTPLERKRVQLEELVVAHNKYYPIEANLPMSPRTLLVMDGGAPWQERPLPTTEALVEAARRRAPPT